MGQAAHRELFTPTAGRGEVDLILVFAVYDRPLQAVMQAVLEVDLAIFGEAEEGLEPRLDPQCRPQLGEHVHLLFARIPSHVRCASRNRDRLPGANVALLTAHAEASGAGEDLEALLLVGVNMLGCHASAPLSAQEAPCMGSPHLIHSSA
jgi:hypothetical protein